MTTTVQGIAGLEAKVGEHLGYSDYVEITQERVNLFAEATGDHQWIHVDVERATTGPFGGPIAHGYLTLSLGPVLLPEILQVSEKIQTYFDLGCTGFVPWCADYPDTETLTLFAEEVMPNFR